MSEREPVTKSEWLTRYRQSYSEFEVELEAAREHLLNKYKPVWFKIGEHIRDAPFVASVNIEKWTPPNEN